MLTVEDVRARVPVSRRTLYDWIKAGTFPKPIKVPGKGPRVYFEPQAVDQWLAAHPHSGI